MSDTNNRPMKGGDLRGDSKPMPDRGVRTGVEDTYGADLKTGLSKPKCESITGDTMSDGKQEWRK